MQANSAIRGPPAIEPTPQSITQHAQQPQPPAHTLTTTHARPAPPVPTSRANKKTQAPKRSERQAGRQTSQLNQPRRRVSSCSTAQDERHILTPCTIGKSTEHHSRGSHFFQCHLHFLFFSATRIAVPACTCSCRPSIIELQDICRPLMTEFRMHVALQQSYRRMHVVLNNRIAECMSPFNNPNRSFSSPNRRMRLVREPFSIRSVQLGNPPVVISPALRGYVLYSTWTIHGSHRGKRADVVS